MSILLRIRVADLPVTWKRMRGKNHFKPADLRAWQEFIADIAREEIELSSRKKTAWPWAGRCEIRTTILYPSEQAIQYAGDPDNIEKAIFDALVGVVIKDDRVRYIRKHSLEVAVADNEDEVGTYISIYKLR